MSYTDFLANKAQMAKPSGFEPEQLGESLFPFQADITKWAIRHGRAAIWADCGLGKTLCALEWAAQVYAHTGENILILTPLAVAPQFVTEGEKFWIDVNLCRESEDVVPGINVTNYDRVERFNADDFIGIILDESSILKDFTSKTRNLLIDKFRDTPYKLACTATPSPNDFTELGNHAEFLGVMTRTEMLSMFFVHDGGSTQDWRLKGHAREDFWQWLCSWAVALRMPSDIGHSDEGFILPPLNMHHHSVSTDMSELASKRGKLFVNNRLGLSDTRTARRLSTVDRCEMAAKMVNGSSEPWIVWCDMNDESMMLNELIPDAVEVRGSDSREHKEKSIRDFGGGRIRVLISKPSICGWGVNWQHCSNAVFVGVSHSFEKWYQAIRRTYRFGQTKQVDCHVITSTAEHGVVSNLLRKQRDAEKMVTEMTKIVGGEWMKNNETPDDGYYPGSIIDLGSMSSGSGSRCIDQSNGIGWDMIHGDCVEGVGAIADDSIDYSVFSPPFASLYTYSNSDRDMGNSRTYGEFSDHLSFLIPELLRVLKPGRLLSFHCMNIPTSKARDGYIGIRDFRGELIRAFVDAGFIYHSEVCIWKDPVTAMQRTKALGLLHKQIRKDSSMSRQGLPDYLVTMRKPGVNPDPVHHTHETFPVKVWQRYASPVWASSSGEDDEGFEILNGSKSDENHGGIVPSETLQYRSARANNDERHICPLQLKVIERALKLWTLEGDMVLSPFAGIGSEGYVSVKLQRRFVGFELKSSYYNQAVRNLTNANAQRELFSA